MPLNPLQLKPFLSLPHSRSSLPLLNPHPSLSPAPPSLHSQEGREADLGLIDLNLVLMNLGGKVIQNWHRICFVIKA